MSWGSGSVADTRAPSCARRWVSRPSPLPISRTRLRRQSVTPFSAHISFCSGSTRSDILHLSFAIERLAPTTRHLLEHQPNEQTHLQPEARRHERSLEESKLDCDPFMDVMFYLTCSGNDKNPVCQRASWYSSPDRENRHWQ